MRYINLNSEFGGVTDLIFRVFIIVVCCEALTLYSYILPPFPSLSLTPSLPPTISLFPVLITHSLSLTVLALTGGLIAFKAIITTLHPSLSLTLTLPPSLSHHYSLPHLMTHSLPHPLTHPLLLILLQ